MSNSIDVNNITPYIATISPDLVSFNCTKLKQAKVAGLMLYGGCYYDILHLPKPSYINTKLKSQIDTASKSSMPYAIYVDVRARSVDEAMLECNQLRYLISKYPPLLGIWLRLQTGRSIRVNNQILQLYYERFKLWGMSNKCGLYINESDLKTFTWDDFCNKYLLWMVGHVSDINDAFDSLLTPEFFMVKEVN